jgi:uncharacterized protein GlcG (DUF336 family)
MNDGTGALAAGPMVTTVNRLHMDVAATIATATVVACRDMGIPIRVTVVDRSGITQVQMRDTTAPPITLNISKKKAYTAMLITKAYSKLRTPGRYQQFRSARSFCSALTATPPIVNSPSRTINLMSSCCSAGSLSSTRFRASRISPSSSS